MHVLPIASPSAPPARSSAFRGAAASRLRDFASLHWATGTADWLFCSLVHHRDSRWTPPTDPKTSFQDAAVCPVPTSPPRSLHPPPLRACRDAVACRTRRSAFQGAASWKTRSAGRFVTDLPALSAYPGVAVVGALWTSPTRLRAFRDAASFEAPRIPLHNRPPRAFLDVAAFLGVAFLPTSQPAPETDLETWDIKKRYKTNTGRVCKHFSVNFSNVCHFTFLLHLLRFILRDKQDITGRRHTPLYRLKT